MVFEGHFVVFFTGRELAFCSSKHFWHSLKKHVVGFQVVFKNQSSFFSETSSWNRINLQDLNRHFLSKCSWGTHFSMQLIAAGVLAALEPFESAFFKDDGFLRWILPTKMKGHSLRKISRLWWDFCGGHEQAFFREFFWVPMAIL